MRSCSRACVCVCIRALSERTLGPSSTVRAFSSSSLMSWIMASWWRGERGKGWGQGERKSASGGGGGGGQNEKPLHPSVFTSRPPSVAGLSLFPHYALLFSLFPFCVFFQRDDNPHISCSCKKTQCQCVCAHKESLHDIASLLAKWNFDDIQVLFGRKRDYAVFSDISRSHCSKSSRCTFNNCCKKKIYLST